MNRGFVFTGVAVMALITVAACVRVGPEYRRPHIGVTIPARYSQAGPPSTGAAVVDRWWMDFADPVLNGLVAEVLSNNWDIKKATARVLEIRSRFVQTRADRFPKLNLQGAGERQHYAAGSFFGSRETESYSLSLPASFELDLWGRLARQEEAARAELLQAVETRRTIAQSIVAETVTSYLKMESLERRIQVRSKSIENYRRTLAIVNGRYKRGLTSILDVKQARVSLAQNEAVLPALRQELGIVQQQLSVLLGRYPKTTPPRKQPEKYFQQLTPVPAGLPSDLLLRRPDVKASEARLMALNAQVGVAKASRFPRITLTGNFGYSSEQLSRLFTPDSKLWNIAAGVVQPVFDAGSLKAAQKAAEARFKQGVSDYAKAVLTAFAEVEQALLTRKEQMLRRRLLVRSLAEARASQDVAEKRYQQGLTDYLNVLVSEQTRFRAEEDVVLADLAILTNRVTLYRVLGGGWGEPQAGRD